jgi:hypothetical protein
MPDSVECALTEFRDRIEVPRCPSVALLLAALSIAEPAQPKTANPNEAGKLHAR